MLEATIFLCVCIFDHLCKACVLSPDALDAKACPSGEFMCANRKCLATVYVCDGDDDCGDGSDELKCTAPLTCGPNHLRCNTSECVPLMWSCDGDPDCSDSSDEGPERCGGDGALYLSNRRANCTAGEFRCANGECVRLTWKCDGDPDCKDKSDESDCRECYLSPCTAPAADERWLKSSIVSYSKVSAWIYIHTENGLYVTMATWRGCACVFSFILQYILMYYKLHYSVYSMYVLIAGW